MLQGNFLDILSHDIGKIDVRLKNPDVCFACASSLLGSVFPNVRIVTSIGNLLSLAEMNLVIGDSGVGKTIPLKVAGNISEKLDNRLPSRYTTEGIEQYFAEQDENGDYVHPNNGIIVCDEIGQIFSEASKKSHYNGTIEELSRLYDHELPSTALVGGVRTPQKPYVCMIGATIPQFLPHIDDMFFQQGLAGRFKWTLGDIDTEKTFDISASLERVDELKNIVSKHSNTLKLLREKAGKSIKYIMLDREVNTLWSEFYKRCLQHWEYGRANCRFGWDWQYKIRLPELMLKQAGKWCIGRNYNQILFNGFDGICISREDIARGIQTIDRSDQQLQTILELRKQGLESLNGRTRNIIRQYNEFTIIRTLENALNQTLNNKQLMESSGIKNPNTYGNLKKNCLEKKLIEVVDKDTITNKEERTRLGVDLRGARLEVIRLVKRES